MPAGRPTDYRKEYCQTVIECGERGCSLAQMADACGTIRDIIADWAKLHPEFNRALTRARELSMIWWEKTAQHNLITPGFQASLWSRSMAARFPQDYTERREDKTTGTLTIKVERDDALPGADKDG